jgi:hypothetical protein
VSQTSRFKAARMGAGLSNIHSMCGTTDILKETRFAENWSG